MLIRELMTDKVITVAADATLGDALFLLRKHHVRHLPVLQNGSLRGMISARDVEGWLTPRIATADEQEGEAEALDYVIEDVMSTSLHTIRDTDDVALAAETLAEQRIGAVPVLDKGGDCIGIVTTVDLLREFARRLREEAPEGR